MKKILALLTKRIGKAPRELDIIALGEANEVVLLQDGVYNTGATLSEALGDAFDHKKYRALDVDVEARNISSDFELITYPGLVDAIENNDSAITL